MAARLLPSVAGYLIVTLLGGCRREAPDHERSQRAQVVESKHTAAKVTCVALKSAACAPECWQDIEQCADARCVSKCPGGEVYVPATGAEGFWMGRGEPNKRDPRHRVVLTRPFCMDETEVTVAAFRQCVERGACKEPHLKDLNANYRPEYARGRHPVNMVEFSHATAFCESLGKALPTEAQWEWAASHGDDRIWPWGNEEPTCDNGYADFTPGGAPKSDPAGDVGCRGGGTSEVKAHPLGKTSWPDGDIYDLSGNVWEWTADCYLSYPLDPQVDPSPQAHPALKGDCWLRVIRGGGWNRSQYALRTYARGAAKRPYKVPGLGFRCVRNPTPRSKP
jgi:formylglycine-generating enzyme required for sulfatase activity